MSDTLADLWVNITAKDEGLHKALDKVHSKLESVKAKLATLSEVSLGGLAALGGAAALFAKEALDAEKAASGLKFALESVNGGDQFDALSEAAERLKKQVLIDGDEIKKAMTQGIHLGISPDQLEETTKAGIGLAKMFGGDLSEGMHAAAFAMQGNDRGLKSLIPQFKNLSPEALREKVAQLAQDGFKEAEKSSGTFGGALSRLKIGLDDAAKSLGGALLPFLNRLASFVQRAVDWFNGLSSAIKESIIHWGLISAAVLAFVAVLPLVISMVSGLVAVFGLLLSPIGLTVAAIVALAAGVLYLAGTGDTFAERMGSGFFKVAAIVANVAGAIIIAWSKVEQFVAEVVQNIVSGTLEGFAKLAEVLGANDIASWLRDAENQTNDFFAQWKAGLKSVEGVGDKLWDQTGDSLRKGVDDFVKDMQDKFNLNKLKLGVESPKPEDFKFTPPTPNVGVKQQRLDIFGGDEGFKRSIISRELAARLGVESRANVGLGPEAQTAKNTADSAQSLADIAKHQEAIKMLAEAMRQRLDKLNTGYAN